MMAIQTKTATAETVAVEGQNKRGVATGAIVTGLQSDVKLTPEEAAAIREPVVRKLRALSAIYRAAKSEGWAMCQRCGCVTIDPEQFAREGCCKCHCRERLQ
jgi:hypothetical protein